MQSAVLAIVNPSVCLSVTHYDNTPFWIPAGTNKDNLECPIHLKVHLVDGSLLRAPDSTICIGVARGG